ATGWLMARSGDPAAVCRSQVQVARSLRSMPLTGEAFARGELSEPRVRLLASAHDFSPELFSRDESLLVSQARTLPSRLFPQALAHWRRLADADGALADTDRALERRRLHISATWGGMVRLDGDLDPESGATVITALGSLAEPQALDPEDRRSPAQRRADALVEICRRHLDSSDRPQVGGERPHLVVTVEAATLQGRGGQVVDLETGPISLEAVRRLACDATVTPISTHRDRVLEIGRRTRLIPSSVRRALNHRDGGCTHPGCDIPARWCDAHHLVHWAEGGPTALSNLRLLCRRHHREAHDHARYPRRE
ncbi:MAG TPA: DUF222 domain-containing protein, partial [Acidimicrobiia bacterium]|nr:DUF222 domain-containing protein [Acidimicrobiia bacterium]